MSVGMLGRIYFPIEVDLPKFEADLRKAKTAAENTTKQMVGLTEFGRRMAEVGQQLTIGVTLPLTLAGGAAAKLGMDAIETENLFRVSMGNMSAEAEAWASDMSKALGLNRYELEKNVGMFNVMFNSIGLATDASYDMAKGMTQLAYDMASFYNLDVGTAFEKLQAGIMGEVEPLRRLGIVVDEVTIKQVALREGIIKQGEEMTQAEKVEARYIAIMEQTSKAQGDLARTAESPANMLRRVGESAKEAGAEFGKAMLPALGAVLYTSNAFVATLKDMDPGLKAAIVTVGGLAAAVGPLLLVTGKLIQAGPQLAATIAYVEAAFGATTGTLMPFLGIIALVAAAIAGLTAHFKAQAEQAERNHDRLETLQGDLAKIDKALKTGNPSESERKDLMQKQKDIYAELNGLLPTTIGLRDAEGQLISVSADALKAYNTEVDKERIAHLEAAKAALEHQKAIYDVRAAQAGEAAGGGSRSAVKGNGTFVETDQAFDTAWQARNQAEAGKWSTLSKQTAEEIAKINRALDGSTDPEDPDPDPDPKGDPKVVTNLERFRREMEITSAEIELMRKQLGLQEGSMQAAAFEAEALNKEYESEAKIVNELDRIYQSLAKSKGLAADATRDAYLELKQEQGVLADIKAQLDAERNAQYANPFTPGAGVWDVIRNSVYGSQEAYMQAVRDMARQKGVDEGVAGSMVDTEAYKKWQEGGYHVTINNNISGVEDPITNERAAQRGTNKALRMAAAIG